MRITFRNQVNAFQQGLNHFDEVNHTLRNTYLKNIAGLPLRIHQDLVEYYEVLLFILAYPMDEKQQNLAIKEISRISSFLKSKNSEQHQILANTGLPFTPTITRFTHDMVQWLLAHPHGKVTLKDFVNPSHSLNEVLRLTLPSLEQPETTAGLDNIELMDVLKVPQSKRLQFIINELSRFDEMPYVKDHLYDRLEAVVCLTPKDKVLSKAFNKLQVSQTYFHQDLLKKIDSTAILNSSVPHPAPLDSSEKEAAILVVKNAMLLTGRETDPCTYMDENSFRLYTLERGLSIAIYGMIPSRQMPLESYVGYTAFKNGYPVAYGGAWIFGERANFGINIFKPYRNGESAFVMAQLLRLYCHVFSIRYFEVEAYQFGLDNPEGIISGAFWFYFRFGFRPLDKKLKAIALIEEQKIKARKGYKTSHKVLEELTGSNIGLSLGQHIPTSVQDIAIRVTRMIGQKYNGDRILAEKSCRQLLLQTTGMKEPIGKDENKVLTEVALWANAMKIEDTNKLKLLMEMVSVKPIDAYIYQSLLLRFFARN